jgi:1-acyl-sn-glycerol-3-phosphate acyltransferase
VYFPLALFNVEIERRGTRPEGPVVFCANHFSYLDVATMPLIDGNACFVGKSSIQKIPLFGYYFKILHISVNRHSLRDRAKALLQNRKFVEQGKSLFIFPEGGIKTVTPPHQVHYKDGAFITAIDMQVPVVPVTIASNWIALPDDGKFLIRNRNLKIIVHEPISTANGQFKQVSDLKKQVFDIIENELAAQNNASNGRNA